MLNIFAYLPLDGAYRVQKARIGKQEIDISKLDHGLTAAKYIRHICFETIFTLPTRNSIEIAVYAFRASLKQGCGISVLPEVALGRGARPDPVANDFEKLKAEFAPYGVDFQDSAQD
jgi:hypothetical protein